MAILNILVYPDTRLRTVAKPVRVVDHCIKKTISDMFDTMYHAKGIGLAATQVNLHQQIIVMDVSENQDAPLTFINPTIIEQQGEQIYDEGCLSIPQFYAPIKRAQSITVSALDKEGQAFELQADNLLSVCIQHEIDHLLGKVFVDYLSKLKRDRIGKKLQKQQKTSHN